MNSILNSAFHVLKESGKANDETKTYIWNFEMSSKFPYWTRELFQFYSFKSLQLCLSGSLSIKQKNFRSSLLEIVPLSSGARPEGNRMCAALELSYSCELN